MNFRLGWLLGCGVVLGGVASVVGCPASFPDNCSDNPNCDSDSGATSDGASNDGAATCDPSKDPSCVSDSSGIFVSPKGADSAAGTKEAPLKTIGAALTKAAGSKSAVYVCVGAYAEHVKVTSPVNLYGGFACTDWTYAATNKPKVAPSDAGYALDIENVSSAVAVQDLEFDAVDGKNAGDSSIAVFVSSSNVTFTRDTLSAGAGVAGTTGTLTPLTFPDQSVLNGNNSDGGTPGAANTVDCPGDAGTITVGGAGGANNGGNGSPGLPALDGGAGGTIVACVGTNTGGQSGASGGTPSNGNGASAHGTIETNAWIPAVGTNGAVGGPGQGGGGGAGISGFGGGGGGAGGCGGAGGGGGTGGGASIALLANASAITFASSNLTSKSAGAGGNGAGGQSGQTPGGFHGNSSGTACVGGAGGGGGSGGAGGGGAGGVSVGVLYKGSAPTVDSATQSAITTASTGGAKGAGGASGTNDGIDGVAQATLEIK